MAKTPIVVDGCEYKSIRDAEVAFGLRQDSAKLRLRRGWSIDEAFNLAPPPSADTGIVVDSRRFPSVSAAEVAFNLRPELAATRLRRGWGIDEAFGLVPRTRENGRRNWMLPVIVEGRQFSSLSEAAEVYGVSPKLAHNRAWDQGWSLEEALGLKKRREVRDALVVSNREYQARSVPVEVGGRRFASMREAYEAHGIRKHTFFKRWRILRWSLEQALGLTSPPNGYLRCLGRVYKVTHLESKKAYIGITRSSLTKRWAEHLEKANSGAQVHSQSLHAALRLYGPEAFRLELLDTAQTEGELTGKERQLIRECRTFAPDGFNLTRGGEGASLRGVPTIVQGVHYPSQAAAARACGLSPQCFRRRIRKGWTPQEVDNSSHDQDA